MYRYATLSSSVYAPRFSPSGNLVVCTGSGHIVEFIDDSNGSAQAKVLLEIDGQPSSVAFDNGNEMIICDISSQSLAITSYGDKENQKQQTQQISLLCNEYENKPFKGPSCCIVDKFKRKFFTDSGPMGDTSLQSPKGSVYCINKEGILRPLSHNNLAQPTSLAISPNGRCIYVCEMFKNRILRFVETDNNNGVFMSSVFYQFNGCVGPSGIDIDTEGNLFVTRFEHKDIDTTGLLSVIDPNGRLVVEIPTKAPQVTGVAFDKSNNIVYITELSTNSVYAMHADDIFLKSKKMSISTISAMQQT